MGIYLPNMEIPKDTLLITIGPDGTVDVRRNDALTWLTLKDKAVFVPAHGRLGDLDEIVRYKERLVVDADKIIPEIRYVVDTKYIVDAPTIIPAEEGET